jgi:E3 ubiquitin-protein ligase RAD18
MEELVEAFKAARPEVLQHARKPEVVVADIPKRRREADVEEAESPPKKRTRSSARTTQSSQRVVVLDSDGEDEDYVPGEIFDEFYPIFYANTAIFRRRIRALSHL